MAVAIAAPFIPNSGKPNFPKISAQSKNIFTIFIIIDATRGILVFFEPLNIEFRIFINILKNNPIEVIFI